MNRLGRARKSGFGDACPVPHSLTRSPAYSLTGLSSRTTGLKSKVRPQFLLVLACALAIAWSCWALFGPAVKLRHFAAKSRSPDGIERWVAVHGLTALGADGIWCLIANLRHENPTVRLTAAQGLRMTDDPLVLPAFLGALDDSDASVRCEAVDALGAIGNRVAIPALIRRLDDHRGFVRFRAAIALDDLGCDAGVPEFIRHINHIMLGDMARERLERISQRRFGFDRLKWEIWWAFRLAMVRDAQRFALFEDVRNVSAGE